MSVTFTKLFSSITESTVWCEPDRTRLVWITMLAMADKHGRIWGSIPGLANRARVPVDDARIAITTFLSPDPDSRTPDHDGKRIEPIDGGWRLLNYKKYRGVRDEEERRTYKANKEAERRERLRGQNGQTWTGVDPNGHNAEAEAEAEAVKQEQKQKQASPSAPSCDRENEVEPFDPVAAASETQIPCGNDKPNGHENRNEAQKVYAVYPKKVGSKDALRSIGKAIDRLRSQGTADPVAYLIARIETWLARRARDATLGEFVPSYPNPATWFNQERYNDPDNAPKPKIEYYVLSPEESAELWEREVVRHGQVHT